MASRLSGRLNPPDGAKFVGVIMGEPEDLWLLASDAGYGFTVRMKELITDRRAGKTVLNVPDKALVLPPAFVASPDSLVCAVSSEGKMLAFMVKDLPEMPRGKGNKIYDIPGKKAAAREETLTAHRRGAAERQAGAVVGRQAEDARLGRSQGVSRASARSGAPCSTRGWREIDRLEGQPA